MCIVQRFNEYLWPPMVRELGIKREFTHSVVKPGRAISKYILHKKVN